MLLRLLAALIFCPLVFFLPAGNARALPFSLATVSPGEQCRTAIAAAERGHGVPPQLLASIGRVESGRRDPVSGVSGAWPWTINAEGAGAYFESKAEAIQAVQALQARGVRSIDVGCMQVNLKHHPTAFANLDMAFEPAVNADYAARFLVELHEQTGDWIKATADYHSSNPEEGGPYAAMVTAVWPEEQRKAGLAPSAPVGIGHGGLFAAPVSPFPARQPARLFAMAGMPPMMATPLMATRVRVPLGMASGMASPGIVQPGAGSGQLAVLPGRGLDFYRAATIRTIMPMRSVLRLPNMVTR